MHPTISDRVRLALRAIGLRQFLRTASYISGPCGREQGINWDHIRAGSGPCGSGESSRACFLFPLLMENIPRNLGIYSMENSTGVRRVLNLYATARGSYFATCIVGSALSTLLYTKDVWEVARESAWSYL